MICYNLSYVCFKRKKYLKRIIKYKNIYNVIQFLNIITIFYWSINPHYKSLLQNIKKILNILHKILMNWILKKKLNYWTILTLKYRFLSRSQIRLFVCLPFIKSVVNWGVLLYFNKEMTTFRIYIFIIIPLHFGFNSQTGKNEFEADTKMFDSKSMQLKSTLVEAVNTNQWNVWKNHEDSLSRFGSQSFSWQSF